MPSLPQTFDAYPIAITLDGNGTGTVAFQPNGCTVSISRLFVQVSTVVNQATVTLYKGSISPTSAIGTIVSGSTGGIASGQIFVTDGQILYVVWTGGDAGATATATFSGRQVSFSEVGSDSITWTDPIAASDGSLIFPAIKSPNFVSGSTGWELDRDGNAELNNVIVRGEVDVNGPNGSYVRIDNFSGYPSVRLEPLAVPGYTISSGAIYGNSFNTGASAQPETVILSPTISDGTNTGSLAVIELIGSSADRTTAPGKILLSTANVYLGNGSASNAFVLGTANISGNLIVQNKDVGRGLFNHVDATSDSSAVPSASEAVVLTLPSATYKAGRAYNVVHKGQATMGTAITNNILNFRIRKTNVAGAVVRFLGRTAQVSTQTIGIDQQGIFTVTGSDVTAVLVLCLATPTGSTGTHNADPTFPREINIYDIGLASDYPNAPQLT